jgi:hypothetical protein
VLYQRTSTERGQSPSLHDGNIDWTCDSCVWNELYSEPFDERNVDDSALLGGNRQWTSARKSDVTETSIGWRGSWRSVRDLDRSTRSSCSSLLSTENRRLLTRISNSLPIAVKPPMSCNATIKEAVRRLVAINFLPRFLLESLASTNMVAIRQRHYVTLIWTLRVVVVTCHTRRRVVPFQHSVNCSWLTEFSRPNFYPIDTDYLSLFVCLCSCCASD